MRTYIHTDDEEVRGIKKKIISLNIGIVKRSAGREVVQLAAYNNRNKYYSVFTGVTYNGKIDPSGKPRDDLMYHNVFLPVNAPNEYHDAERLWNSVELKEKCKNAQLARKIVATFPRELELQDFIIILTRFVEKYFVSRGMCVDCSIHDKGVGNPHAHMLLTMRSLDKDGHWMQKQQRNYLLDEHGMRVRDPITKKYVLGRSIKINDWDNKSNAEVWRRGWSDCCNEMLKIRACDIEMTYMSYVRQGIDDEPTIHLGPQVCALEKKGKRTDRGKRNSKIIERNKERKQIKTERIREKELRLERTKTRSR